MNCDCKDWEDNIILVNVGSPNIGGPGCYEGKKFIYCPWCSKILKKIVKKIRQVPSYP